MGVNLPTLVSSPDPARKVRGLGTKLAIPTLAFCAKMASADDIDVTVAAELQNWTLTDVTPVDDELGRGAYGKVFTVRYR